MSSNLPSYQQTSTFFLYVHLPRLFFFVEVSSCSFSISCSAQPQSRQDGCDGTSLFNARSVLNEHGDCFDGKCPNKLDGKFFIVY